MELLTRTMNQLGLPIKPLGFPFRGQPCWISMEVGFMDLVISHCAPLTGLFRIDCHVILSLLYMRIICVKFCKNVLDNFIKQLD